MDIALEYEVVSRECPACGVDFPVVRGAAYEHGTGFGLFLIALHGHTPTGRLAHLAVAVLDRSTGDAPRPIAAAMNVLDAGPRFELRLDAWDASPWKGESYLGRLLAPDEVRASPHRATFFEVADRVLGDVPEVRMYFGGPADPPSTRSPCSMSEQRLIAFAHDGHRFEASVRRRAGAVGEAQVAWVVTMDGAPALEFEGPYPYRDDDVRKRVVEWYEIQKR
jgi:hypothetical protein